MFVLVFKNFEDLDFHSYFRFWIDLTWYCTFRSDSEIEKFCHIYYKGSPEPLQQNHAELLYYAQRTVTVLTVLLHRRGSQPRDLRPRIYAERVDIT